MELFKAADPIYMGYLRCPECDYIGALKPQGVFQVSANINERNALKLTQGTATFPLADLWSCKNPAYHAVFGDHHKRFPTTGFELAGSAGPTRISYLRLVINHEDTPVQLQRPSFSVPCHHWMTQDLPTYTMYTIISFGNVETAMVELTFIEKTAYFRDRLRKLGFPMVFPGEVYGRRKGLPISSKLLGDIESIMPPGALKNSIVTIEPQGFRIDERPDKGLPKCTKDIVRINWGFTVRCKESAL